MKKQVFKPIKITAINGCPFTLQAQRMWCRSGIRCVSRSMVKLALLKKYPRIECYSSADKGDICPWEINRYPNGEIGVGCLTFNKKTVAIIRKWAMSA